MLNSAPRTLRALLLAAAAAAASAAAPSANAGDSLDDPINTSASALAMGADLLAVRPLGLAATAIGTVVFVVGLPIELISGDVSTPAHKLVVEPAEFTFTRPLGESH